MYEKRSPKVCLLKINCLADQICFKNTGLNKLNNFIYFKASESSINYCSWNVLKGKYTKQYYLNLKLTLETFSKGHVMGYYSMEHILENKLSITGWGLFMSHSSEIEWVLCMYLLE